MKVGEACTAAVLVLCVSLAVLSIVLGAWSVRCAGRVNWVGFRCFQFLVFLNGARRLELSPCKTVPIWHMHAGMRPHAPGHQEAGHTVPALPNGRTPPRV